MEIYDNDGPLANTNVGGFIMSNSKCEYKLLEDA